MEIWKDVKNYEGLYTVSNIGKVKSLNYARSGKPRILKSSIDNDGYGRICLTKNKKRKFFLVHRLVAINFIRNTDNKPCINHIDGNKTNNNISNLEWCTIKENNIHAFRTGLNKPIVSGFSGAKNPSSKAIVQYDMSMCEIRRFVSVTEACNYYGYSTNSLHDCLKGRTTKSHGSIWRYV